MTEKNDFYVCEKTTTRHRALCHGDIPQSLKSTRWKLRNHSLDKSPKRCSLSLDIFNFLILFFFFVIRNINYEISYRRWCILRVGFYQKKRSVEPWRLKNWANNNEVRGKMFCRERLLLCYDYSYWLCIFIKSQSIWDDEKTGELFQFKSFV